MMAVMNWRMVQAAELLGSGFQVQALSRCFFVGTLIRFWQCWKPKGASMAFFSLLTGSPGARLWGMLRCLPLTGKGKVC